MSQISVVYIDMYVILFIYLSLAVAAQALLQLW